MYHVYISLIELARNDYLLFKNWLLFFLVVILYLFFLVKSEEEKKKKEDWGTEEKKKRKTGGARKLARKNVKSTTVGVTSFVSTEIEIRRLLLLRVITSFWILYFWFGENFFYTTRTVLCKRCEQFVFRSLSVLAVLRSLEKEKYGLCSILC